MSDKLIPIPLTHQQKKHVQMGIRRAITEPVNGARNLLLLLDFLEEEVDLLKSRVKDLEELLTASTPAKPKAKKGTSILPPEEPVADVDSSNSVEENATDPATDPVSDT